MGFMPVSALITRPNDVDNYLEEHGLEDDCAPLEAVLLQSIGASESGRPAVLLVCTIGGKKHVVKTSLRMLLLAAEAMNSVTEQTLGPSWRG